MKASPTEYEFPLTLDVKDNCLAGPPSDRVDCLTDVTSRPFPVNRLEHQGTVGENHTLRGVVTQRNSLEQTNRELHIKSLFFNKVDIVQPEIIGYYRVLSNESEQFKGCEEID